MIAAVSRGTDVGATLRYLYGPGGRDPHHDPHLVAAFRPPNWLEPPLRPNGSRDLRELAELLCQPIAALRCPVGSPWVWRCSARTAPADRHLSDAEWADVATEILDRTGLVRRGTDGVRWIAVRHAIDHIHLVAILADSQGRRHRLPYDRLKVRQACRIVEDRYDLRRTAPPDRTSAPAPIRAEIEQAQLRGSAPPRFILRDAIHAAAVVAGDERNFFERLDGADIAIHRRRDDSGEVIGYAVALPGHTDPNGTPYFFGGGKLAPDLTLPKLRHRWAHRAGPCGDGAALWRNAAGRVTDAAAELGAKTDACRDLAWAAADLLGAMAYCFPGERLLRRAVHFYDQAAREPGGVIPAPIATGDRLRGLARDLMRSAEALDPARRDTRPLFEALPSLIRATARLREAQGRASQAGVADRAAGYTQQCAGHTPMPSAERTVGLAQLLNPPAERKDRTAKGSEVFTAARPTSTAPASRNGREPDVGLRHRT